MERIDHLTLDDQVFDGLLQHLYYPSPYRFDVIPSKTLSDIYDLFLGYELRLEDGNIVNTLRSEYKKSNGAVTTPRAIVERVLAQTFDNRLRHLTSRELLSLRIADPACGSGVFLVSAFDHLAKAYLARIEQGDTADKGDVVMCDGKAMLTIDGKKRLMNSCLYGVDINPEAVEVAKMSLSLKIIDDYETMEYQVAGLHGDYILRSIGENLRCGNSLVASDVLQLYPSLQKNLQELVATRIFAWRDEFKDVFESKGGFDFVVGNPPYVEVKNYNTALPVMSLYIKQKYSSSRNGKIDLAIPFVECGLELLNATGRLGYIVQKRFFKTDYGKGIRRLLTEGKLVSSIHDYTETDLFAGRITYVAILVCDRDASHNTTISYTRSDSDRQTLLPAASLGSTPWTFDNTELNSLRLSLADRLQTLGDYCHVKVGLQVLWDKAYHLHSCRLENGILYGQSAIDDHVAMELAACRPLVCNERFSSLAKPLPTTYAIFPYDIMDGECRPILFREFRQRFPLAAKYLSAHKAEITANVQTLPERDRRIKAKDGWHLYTRAINHTATYRKVCIPMTALRPQAAVIGDENVYCDNANMFFIQTPHQTEDELYALSAVISSDIFMVLAKAVANPQSGGYMKFNKQFLDPIPIPLMKRGVSRLADTARKIEQLNARISESGGMNTTPLETMRTQLLTDMNRQVADMYGLTPSEQQTINSAL